MDATLKVTEIRASRGAAWIVEAWKLFAAAPLPWLGLCAGWIAISLALVIVPFVGPVIAAFLQPAFSASFAIAAYRQSVGERVVMADLFGGFRRNLKALVNLGAILLMAGLVIFTAMTLLGLPLPTVGSGEPEIDVKELSEALEGKEWIVYAGTFLVALVNGAFWFAPQLIAFHGMGTAQAIRWSVYAAISNVGALAVYGLIVWAMFMVVFMTMPWVFGLIVALPLLVISNYAGYREVFEAAKPQ